MSPCAPRTAGAAGGVRMCHVLHAQGASPLSTVFHPLRGSHIRRALCAGFTYTRGAFAPQTQESRRDGI